jgi:hypothetical protein
MKRETVCRVALAVLLAMSAAWVMSGCARVEPRREEAAAPPVPDLSGRFPGTLVAEGVSVPLGGTVIRSGDVLATAAPDGRFSFRDLPRGKNLIVAEKRFESGPVRRVLGVTVVYVLDNPYPVSLKMRDATDVDRYCGDCHPRGNTTRNDQIVRCLHVSGVAPKQAKGWPESRDGEGRVTCESCHTLHQPGKWPHHLRETMDQSLLCRKCHTG